MTNHECMIDHKDEVDDVPEPPQEKIWRQVRVDIITNDKVDDCVGQVSPEVSSTILARGIVQQTYIQLSHVLNI